MHFHPLHLEHLFPHLRSSSLLHIDKGSRNISYLPQMITVLLQRLHCADKNAEGLLKGVRCLSCKIQLHLCNSSANGSKSFWITASDSGVCDSDPHPSPLPMQSKAKAPKCNKVTGLFLFPGLIFLWDEHLPPPCACACASLESFHLKRPLSVMMAFLGRAVSEWRGFHFDNSPWAFFIKPQGQVFHNISGKQTLF